MKKFALILFTAFAIYSSYAQSPGKLVRKGNYELMGGNVGEAEIKYRKALEEKPGFSTANYNLGNTKYMQEEYETAIQKYNDAIAGSDNPQQLSNYYYNLGNALFKSEKLEESITAFKNALRNDANNEDARHNLFLAQQLLKQQKQQQQQQQQDQKKPPEPTEFAKQLRKQAQELVSQRKYSEAYNLMIEGEKKDPSVGYYKDFTEKIKEVDEINAL